MIIVISATIVRNQLICLSLVCYAIVSNNQKQKMTLPKKWIEELADRHYFKKDPQPGQALEKYITDLQSTLK